MRPSAFATAALSVILTLAVTASAFAKRVEHEIRSKHPRQTRVLAVHLPDSYQQSRHHYPVLFVLDGENNLDHAVAVASFLAENGAIPEMIVIGLQAGATRSRDYLPPNDTEGAPSGRADQFLAYVETELVPFIEKTYRAAPLRLLSGHSYGGVFATYAMVEAPGLFHGILTQSPYLDEAIGSPLLARLPKGVDDAPDFFYLSLGNEPQLEPGFDRLKAALSAEAAGDLRLAARRFPEKTHMTTRLVALYDGLETAFAADWPIAQQSLVGGRLEALEGHIGTLSKRYGYPVLYSESGMQQAVQTFLALQDWSAATGAARLYADTYRESPLAHFLLASALNASSQPGDAATAIDEAIRLYEANPTPKLASLVPAMQGLRQHLSAAE